MDVREAARRTLDAGSARVWRTAFFDGTAHPLVRALLATQEGELDLTRRRARLRIMDSPDVDRAVEWAAKKWPWLADSEEDDDWEPPVSLTIVAAGRRYVRFGDRWTLAERPDGSDDPAWILDVLVIGGSGGRSLGWEDVRGTACERWALEPVELQVRPRRTLRGDVWTDTEGLIRRITWTRPPFGRRRLRQEEPPAMLWQTVELWDFGLPVTIEVPEPEPPEDYGPLLPDMWDAAKWLWRRRAAYKRGR